LVFGSPCNLWRAGSPGSDTRPIYASTSALTL
jgi:hypothetical protein